MRQVIKAIREWWVYKECRLLPHNWKLYTPLYYDGSSKQFYICSRCKKSKDV